MGANIQENWKTRINVVFLLGFYSWRMCLRFCLFPIFLISFIIAQANSISVCSTCSITSIRQAVKLSNTNDTILLTDKIYKEHTILINKPLTIISNSRSVIDAEFNGGVFIIENTKKVNIKGISIKNIKTSYVEDLAAIKIIQSNGCKIENSIIENGYYGIYISKSDSCVLTNNKITASASKESSAGNGIHLWYCKNAFIKDNKVSGHRDGIYFEFVEYSTIKNNLCTKQLRYGLHFMFSNNCDYIQNEFRNNGAGVAVMYSKKINVIENKFIDNWSSIAYGILLKDIYDSNIEKNEFKKNTMAIYAEGCNRNNFKNNTFTENGWALKILGNCDDNTVIENNFISNTFEVVTNSSRNNNVFSNNYWGNYNGYDLNKDGIGDVAHTPITLFSYMLEQIPPSIVLLRSLFIDLLNLVEKITPVITPESYKDEHPRMKPLKW